MSLPAKYDITHWQGDTYSVVLTLTGDYTAHTHKFEIKSILSGTPILELTTGGSGIVLGAYANGVTPVTITITATQSAAIVDTTIYNYDYQVQTGVVVTTLLTGTFAQQVDFAE